MDIKDIAGLKAAYPDLCDQIADEAAKSERDRIKAIEDAAVDGYEDIAESAKFEKPISAADMAVQILNSMKKQGAAYLQNRAKDAADSNAGNVQQQNPVSDDKDDQDFKAAMAAVFGKEGK